MTVPEALALGLQHHQSGRLAEAEAIYRQILAVAPQEADARHLLGVLAHQMGRNEVAVEMIREAIALLPTTAAFHSNLGVALAGLGRFEEAIVAYRSALQLEPDDAEAHNNLGNALSDQGHPDEAMAAYRRAIQSQPDYAKAHNNLGIALRERGQLADAVAAYRRAIRLMPDFPEAHNNLGAALREQGQLDEAVAEGRHAVQLNPDYADGYNNLGVALREQGQIDEAIAACRRALQLRPNHADAWNNLGVALAEQDRPDEAMAAYRRAIELKPDNAEAFSNLGAALRGRGCLDEAVAACRRAIELRPNLPEAHNNLGAALRERGRLDEATEAFQHALQFKPDYVEAHNNLANALKDHGRLDEAIAGYRRALQLRPDDARVRCNLLFDLHYLPEFDPEEMTREHCRWEEVHARPLARFMVPHRHVREAERRLRIGYVSPDFREHPVAFFMEGLLAAHDRAEVEVICYADLIREDAVSARLRQHVGQWRRITGLKDEQVADLVRQDGIDILVDLAGHTANNRLLVFARKPAPVQVTWLGYPDTTGMEAMDYRLTDGYVDPPGASEHLHSEKLIRLPEIFACFRPAVEAPPVRPRPAGALNPVTFACFHKLAKLNAPLLECWARILQKVPDARLLLAGTGFDEGSQQVRLRAFFEGKGIGLDRLEFEGRQSLAQYLALHHEVDVLLDSHPFSGHTTSCHALWMGVPVVTLAGARHCGRMVASVLNSLGLPEWIARTEAEYVKIACELARDATRRAELRSTLRERMRASPLMDAPRFARNVENAYRQMWRAWCAEPCSSPTP